MLKHNPSSARVSDVSDPAETADRRSPFLVQKQRLKLPWKTGDLRSGVSAGSGDPRRTGLATWFDKYLAKK